MGCIYLETVFNGFFNLQISSDARCFFLFWPRHCDQGLIVLIEYFFQIWIKKDHTIISSHMGPMYIETPYRTGVNDLVITIYVTLQVHPFLSAI